MRRLFILDKTLKVCYTLLKFKKGRHSMEKPNEGFYSVLRKATGKLEMVEVQGYRYQFEGNWYHLSSAEMVCELRPPNKKCEK